MNGGFRPQQDGIQAAIGHLTALLNEAQANGRNLERLQHLVQPGGAKQTAGFHRAAASSSADLVTQHAEFVSSIEDQIHKLRSYGAAQ